MEQISRFIEEMPDERTKRHMQKMNQNGQYAKRQFIDASMGLNRNDYIKWLKQAKKSFFHTISAEQIIISDREDRIRKMHSALELITPAFNNYSPLQIIETMRHFDTYTVMFLLSKGIKDEFKSSDKFPYPDAVHITGTCNGHKIGVIPLPVGKPFFYLVTDDQQIRPINAKEFLLTELCLPLEVILNTTNLLFNPDYIPEASDLIFDERLYDGLVDINTSKTYQKLKANQI